MTKLVFLKNTDVKIFYSKKLFTKGVFPSVFYGAIYSIIQLLESSFSSFFIMEIASRHCLESHRKKEGFIN